MLVDLLHASTLQYRPLEDLLSQTRHRYGQPVDGIVYPGWSKAGMNILEPGPIRSAIAPPVMPEAHPESDVGAVAHACKRHGLRLWLTLDPALQFISSALTNVRDNFGASTPKCCFNLPHSRTLMALLFDQVLASIRARDALDAIGGVLISAQDLWGLSARQGEIAAVCFCDNCIKLLNTYGARQTPPFQYADLGANPDAWKLGLNDEGRGLDSVRNFHRDTGPDELIALSRARGFHAKRQLVRLEKANATIADTQAAWTALRQQASVMLAYVRAFEEITRDSTRALGSLLKEKLPAATIAVALDNDPYDWNARVFYDAFFGDPVIDEVWIEPSNAIDMKGMPHRQILCRRGYYTIQAFYEALDDYLTPELQVLTGRPPELRAGIVRERLGGARIAPYQDSLTIPLLASIPGAQGLVASALTGDSFADVARLVVGPALDEEPSPELAQVLEWARRFAATSPSTEEG